MKHKLFFLVSLWGLNALSQNLSCHSLFSSQNNLSVQQSALSRKKMAQTLVDIGLTNSAYAVQWKLKDLKYKGPLESQGEFLVVGLDRNKQSFQDWVEQVAGHTIGLAINGLPENNPGSAMLRIGRRFYSFVELKYGGGMKGVDIFEFKKAYPWTEVTYEVTPNEMKEIVNFFKAREQGEIIAKFDMRNGIKKGNVLSPKFDSESIGLIKESCAGICSSFYNPDWLAHYDNNQVLVQLRDRLNLQPYHIAKQVIWANARRSHLAAITLVGIERSEKQLTQDFIENNEWEKLRGMPAHGLIPDMPNGNSITIHSTRQSLTDWLDSQR